MISAKNKAVKNHKAPEIGIPPSSVLNKNNLKEFTLYPFNKKSTIYEIIANTKYGISNDFTREIILFLNFSVLKMSL